MRHDHEEDLLHWRGRRWPAWHAPSASPAAAQNREHQQMTADVRMLQEQTQQLRSRVAALNEALNEAIKALNARLDDTNKPTARGSPIRSCSIDNMANDVRVVRERSDDTNVRIASLREELEALRSSVLAMQQQQPRAGAAAGRRSQRADRPERAGAASPPPAPPPLPSTAGSRRRACSTPRARDYFAGQYSLRDHRLRGVPEGVPALGVGRRRAATSSASRTTSQNRWRRRRCRIQCRSSRTTRVEHRARGVLQARAGAGADRADRRRARVVGNGGQELPGQRRRAGWPSRASTASAAREAG